MAEDSLDDFVEDELWENQRRDGSNGAWLPAEERGRFSDRFGRFRFSSLSSVPAPKNSRVVEDWHLIGPLEQWQYGRTYAALESDLAKGISRFEQKWNSSVRWRRYVRKRRLDQVSSEVMSGWLGSKERRGTWKSRYFILLSGGAASCVATGAGGSGGGGIATTGTGGEGGSSSQVQMYESEDESSNDELGDDAADEPEEDSKLLTLNVQPTMGEEDTSPQYLSTPITVGSGQNAIMRAMPSTPGGIDLSRSLEKPPSLTDVKNAPEQEHPPVLLYFRRGFTDARSIFAGSFDLNEIRSFPKKQVRILKLSNRAKVDDSLWNSEHPGKFSVKVSSARKRVLNAASSDQRERWVEALRTVIEEGTFDGTASPTSRRHGPLSAAFRAAKRGQQELRKGLGGLRRSSQSGAHPALSLSTSLQLTPLAMPVNSPQIASTSNNVLSPGALFSPHLALPPSALGLDLPTYQMDLLRSMPLGTLNLRLHEIIAGKGLVVENIHEHARDAQTGAFPVGLSVGDVVVAIQGEPLVGLEKGKALRKLKEVLGKFPVSEKVTLTLTKAPPKRLASPKRSSSSPNGGDVSLVQLQNTSPSSPRSPLKTSFGLDGDESEREDHAREQQQMFADAAMIRSLQLERHPSTGSMSSSAYGTDHGYGHYIVPNVSLLSPPLATTLMRPSQRPKVSEVPLNAPGITSAMARSTTKACLERMLMNSSAVTYAQLRHEVARQLHAETVMDSDEWRFFFRDLLDYWLCDGIKYAVGGLDMSDFTPIISKVSEASESAS